MDYMDAYNIVQQNAQQNNAWSAQMAANNMQFQLDMANTAHQREVADLKAAGLNPILSAHGNGASVGSGAMASPENNSAALASILQEMIASQTAIGVANAKAAGGGYVGYTGNQPIEKPINDNDAKGLSSPHGILTINPPSDTEVVTPKQVSGAFDRANAWAALIPGATGKIVRTALGLAKKNADWIADGINQLGDTRRTKGSEETLKNISPYFLEGF